ncbi:RNA polymerase sigma factor [Polyangium mundeleinium]|uniref:Sigma-70 family RNA polymerase sigma factor n=1 Tax=Polyangium mundeleinium TaxID=2995306 RepID=A0ABT5EW74_9BACT|nr:sigma-70 family RNA polymerase sigma factor [Polyangium mundeleinium]MDC0746055.1 sigma-70 family RNA polymerase sigma factor [Polyangium mundeleinium]
MTRPLKPLSELAAVQAALRRFGVDGPDVEDLCQDVFVVAIRRGATSGGWLVQTARKLAANHRRLHRHWREVIDLRAVRLASAAPEDGLARVHLRCALRRIKDEDRELLVRHVLGGETLAELAEGLGVSKSGVHGRLKRVCRALRKSLSRG